MFGHESLAAHSILSTWIALTKTSLAQRPWSNPDKVDREQYAA
jgi:hypothetical protein